MRLKGTLKIMIIGALLLIILSQFSPFFNRLIGVEYVLFSCMILIGSALLFYPRLIPAGLTVIMLVMGLLTFFANVDTVGLAVSVANYFIYIIPVFIAVTFFYFRKHNNQKVISSTLSIVLFVTMFTTAIGLLQFPESSRWLATVDNSDDAYFIFLNMRNIGGYTFIYSIVLINALIVILMRNQVMNSLYGLLWLLAIAITVLLSKYTIALLVLIISYGLFIVPRRGSNPRKIMIMIFILLLLVIMRNQIGDLMYFLSEHIPFYEVKLRLHVVGDMLNGVVNNSEANTRLPLILGDLSVIRATFPFGTILNGGTSSGHSFILGFLANYGVLALLILLFLYISLYSFLRKNLSGYFSSIDVLMLLIFPGIISLLNTGMFLIIILFVYPVLTDGLSRRVK